MTGMYIVTQHGTEGSLRRDFDAEEWSYDWFTRNGVGFLRMEHDGDPGATDSCDFIEFSMPVSIEFQSED